MAWFDAILGPFDLIDATWHTIQRLRRTKARNRRARTQSGAVLIRVPHPDASIRKKDGGQSMPQCVEVNEHLKRNGVRTWFGRFDSEWLHLVARESQRSQVEWLLSGELDVTSYDRMRGWGRRWADAPATGRQPRQQRRQRRRERRTK